jgi:HTH-type transcriptional regulator/antitoxin HigA
MEIKPIVTKADHRAALKQIEALMPARLGTPEGDRLDSRESGNPVSL